MKADQLSKQIFGQLTTAIGVEEFETVRQALKRAVAALLAFKPVKG